MQLFYKCVYKCYYQSPSTKWIANISHNNVFPSVLPSPQPQATCRHSARHLNASLLTLNVVGWQQFSLIHHTYIDTGTQTQMLKRVLTARVNNHTHAGIRALGLRKPPTWRTEQNRTVICKKVKCSYTVLIWGPGSKPQSFSVWHCSLGAAVISRFWKLCLFEIPQS